MTNAAIIGAGVVGQATGKGLRRSGIGVTYVDINDSTLEAIRRDGNHAVHPEELNVNELDVLLVSVTALTSENGVDLTHLEDATRNLGSKMIQLKPGHYPIVVFRCTIPPGTTRDKLVPILEEGSGKMAEQDFGVVYMPEFLREATAEEDFFRPRVIAISTVEKHNPAHEFMLGMLDSFRVPIHWLSYETAEFQKYAHNVYCNAVKISVFNELRAVGEAFGLDSRAVEEAITLCTQSAEGLFNPQYGTRDYGPFGGACLPKDTEAMAYVVRELGVAAPILEAALHLNQELARQKQADQQLQEAA